MIPIKKGKNYRCTKTHKYAGFLWIEGFKYYAESDYALINKGCTCFCPKYSKSKHNDLFEEVAYNGCVETEKDAQLNANTIVEMACSYLIREQEGFILTEEDIEDFKNYMMKIIENAKYEKK